MLGFLVVQAFSALAGRVDTLSIRSKVMDRDIRCVVTLPDQYRERKDSFPVLYLLHGYSGAYDDYIKKIPRLKSLVDLFRMIIVCPDGGYSSWYMDSPVDSSYKYETYVALEVPRYIQAHFRTIQDRAHRGIMGLSMGGYGAFYLALRHPDFYGAIGSMSGGVDFRPFPSNWDISKRLGAYATHRKSWDDHTITHMLGALKNGEFAIRMDCGVSDFFIGVNRRLHQKLLSLGIDHDYLETPGTHTWDHWDRAMDGMLLYFFHFFYGKDAVLRN